MYIITHSFKVNNHQISSTISYNLIHENTTSSTYFISLPFYIPSCCFKHLIDGSQNVIEPWVGQVLSGSQISYCNIVRADQGTKWQPFGRLQLSPTTNEWNEIDWKVWDAYVFVLNPLLYELIIKSIKIWTIKFSLVVVLLWKLQHDDHSIISKFDE